MKIFLLILLAAFIGFIVFVVALLKLQTSVPPLDLSDAKDRASKVAAIDSWLEAAHAKHKFNGVILMIRGGDVLLEKCYGFTDYTRSEPLTINSSMRLASVSKQFTAAGIMALNDQGKLAFDDLVSDYIADFPYEGVTIRHLLNNTSGVPNNYMRLGKAHADEYEFLTQAKAVELLIGDAAPATAAPGASYEYSNTNYLLLARIAEIISGQTFEDFMQSNIFTPMGMTHTRIWNQASPDATFPGKTEDFDFGSVDESKPVPLTVLDGVAGDGAVFSSVSDFKIWNEFWTANPIISQDTLAEAFKLPTLADGSTSTYGFGWVVTDNGHFHNGEWLSTQSMFIRNDKNGSVLLVIDNSARLSFDNVVNELAKALRDIEP